VFRIGAERGREPLRQLIHAHRDLLGALKDAPAEGGVPGTLDDAFTLARARTVIDLGRVHGPAR